MNIFDFSGWFGINKNKNVDDFIRARKVLDALSVPGGFRRAWVPGIGCRMIVIGTVRMVRRYRVNLGVALSKQWPYL